MTQLVQGGNAAVPTGRLVVEVSYRPSPRVPEVDVSTFLLRADGRVAGDADMVFYGQVSGAGGAVALEGTSDAPDGGRRVRFALDLPRIPGDVDRLPFVATIHGAESKGLSLGEVAGLRVAVLSGSETVAAFDAAGSGRETSLILGELYRRQGAWKFRAVAQGFEGGLGPLAKSYGMDISDEPAPTAPAPQPAPPPAPATPPQPAPTVSLSKVSLTKASPSVSLAKRGDGFGEVTVNLNWSRAKSGLLSRRSAIDLDVGCLYEMADGRKGGVQALGDAYGDYHASPYIHLLGDDRSGNAADGEWIKVNGRHFDRIERILVYAFIYEGAPNWRATDGVVTVTVPGSAPVEVRLDDGNDASTMCAVALLENVDGQMRISRQVRYFKGHRDMDRAFGWGLNWVAGSKV